MFLCCNPHQAIKWVRASGYEQSITRNISVRVTETTAISVKLNVGSVSEQVSVSANEELVNTTNATLGAVVGTRVLTSLPLATRNVFDLAATDAEDYGRILLLRQQPLLRAVTRSMWEDKERPTTTTG